MVVSLKHCKLYLTSLLVCCKLMYPTILQNSAPYELCCPLSPRSLDQSESYGFHMFLVSSWTKYFSTDCSDCDCSFSFKSCSHAALPLYSFRRSYFHSNNLYLQEESSSPPPFPSHPHSDHSVTHGTDMELCPVVTAYRNMLIALRCGDCYPSFPSGLVLQFPEENAHAVCHLQEGIIREC